MARKKKKFELIEHVTIGDMVAEGKCIVRHQNQVVFVKGAAPGDVADLRVTAQKRRFMEAEPVKFHQLSEQRVEPFCEHFGTCGGCKWQHLSYQAQLQYKQQQVQDALERIGKVQLPPLDPIMGSEQISFYRNKLEFTFSPNGWLTKEEINSGEEFERRALGFHIPGRFDKILDIKHCYLQPSPSNDIRLAVRDYALTHNLSFYDVVKKEGYLRNLIIRTANTGDVMVLVQVQYDDPETMKGLLDYLLEKFPQITSLQYIINPKLNETFHDLEVMCYYGEPFIHEQMEGLRFRIGPKTFYQTNAVQAYELYRKTREFADLQGTELVYDLYTGAGT
ncbi:MAG: 23S rRNA (uracil(1939)-C(5))-methyltransferase RlmD, partial [Hymenobacteraceae bacterium]|nr:23S rRNA (uracil(1939)-C(5))-methyltransferase RlmD [Hymenobacteraceae bacterium]MDX5395715.1 23S rRNA (uracil(1939)-C(5))-methyltransferase RlmD [Hymenobacteraceae bacterium]MDX5511767.1 23S rRNA (uracil(1939)-C(5))-methyltransferase RlmD [Hymenobacteraceae bacterium]